MQTARRLYVYLLSGVSLGVLVTGLSMLLTVLLNRIGLGPTVGFLSGDDESIRQQLTMASALTAVSLPVLLIHWLAAERSIRPDRPNAPAERRSTVRALYFALAMGGLLLAAALGLASALEGMLLRVLGAQDFGYRDIGGGLAIGIVAGAAMAYHVRIRARDWARGPMTGASAWLPRTYLYVATFAGLTTLLVGMIGLIELVGRLLLDQPLDFSDGVGSWWTHPLASALTGIMVGGAIWFGHSWFADRVRADAGHRGASERTARLRLAFFVLAIASGAGTAMYMVAEAAGNAFAALLGVSDVAGSQQMIGVIALPLLTAIPFAISWWMHGRRMRAESESLASQDRLELAHRLETYPVALIGLAFGAVASAWLIGLTIDVVLGGGRVLSGGDAWQRELTQFAPFALTGWAVWIWRWREVAGRWAVDPMGEAGSTVRRATLLIALAGSVMAGVGSLGIILHRLFGSLFGVSMSSNAVAELSAPIGVLLVAILVAIFHLAALRRDHELRATVEAPSVGAAMVMPTALLRLTGPATADLAGVVATLRQQLPPGYGLDVAEGS